MGQPAVKRKFFEETESSERVFVFSVGECEELKDLLREKAGEIEREIARTIEHDEKDWLVLQKRKLEALLNRLSEFDRCGRIRF